MPASQSFLSRCLTGLACLACLGGFSGSLHAAPPLKLGDAEVVPLHHWEIWTTFEYERTAARNLWRTPTFEVIYGLLPRTELAVETAYDITDNRIGTGGDCGLAYVSLQPKVQLIAESGHLPAIAAFCKLEVPLDDSRFDWSGREWALALAAEKHFGDHLLVAHARCFLDADGEVAKWRYGANWSHACGDRLRLLAELYAESHPGAAADELNFRLGLKFRLTESGKIYAAAGRSLLNTRGGRPSLECATGVMFEF